MVYGILTLLAWHWLGDFVCQSHYMATNKSKQNDVLALHVAAYSTVVLFGAFCMFLPTDGLILWFLLNAVLHFATDYGTSRWTSYLWSEKKVHDFFVVVGLDQLIHQVCLIVTAVLLLEPRF